MVENIYIYFSSDLHSHFENWPKMMQYVNEKIQIHKRNQEEYFLFDNGDHVDRVHPITESSLGKSNVSLLNHGKYDVVTIGNNEGITLPTKQFYHLYDEAAFEVVCANLKPMEKEDPHWLQPYTVLTTKSGVRIGIIGLTAPFNAFYKPLNWYATNPYDELEKYLPTLKSESDIIILLSHLGLSEDEKISKEYDDIDVIIGGHTHHLFKNGELVDNTLLGAVGKFGYYIGQIFLRWDHNLEKLVDKQAYAVDVTEEQSDKETETILRQYEREAEQILSQPVATLPIDVEIDWFEDNVLLRNLTNVLQEWTNADVAMLNSGLLLDGLKKGVVTKGDIHRICPHPINPVTVTIKGDELLETIRMARSQSFMEFTLKGFGFRGEILGKMYFSNIEIPEDKHDPILINGEPLDHEKLYAVATADMFTFGRLLPAISKAKTKKYYLPEFLRDLLVISIKRMNA